MTSHFVKFVTVETARIVYCCVMAVILGKYFLPFTLVDFAFESAVTCHSPQVPHGLSHSATVCCSNRRLVLCRMRTNQTTSRCVNIVCFKIMHDVLLKCMYFIRTGNGGACIRTHGSVGTCAHDNTPAQRAQPHRKQQQQQQ